jgi:hypothetical protein
MPRLASSVQARVAGKAQTWESAPIVISTGWIGRCADSYAPKHVGMQRLLLLIISYLHLPPKLCLSKLPDVVNQ